MIINGRYSSIIFLQIFLFEVQFYGLGISYQARDFKQILFYISFFIFWTFNRYYHGICGKSVCDFNDELLNGNVYTEGSRVFLKWNTPKTPGIKSTRPTRKFSW